MTASFVFLGSKCDPQLRSVCTDLTPRDVLANHDFTAAGLYDEGRPLLVATTGLDAQQRIIWSIDAIAKSGHLRAQDLVRRILLVSAAVPGAFPPTMIDVTLDGLPRQAMPCMAALSRRAFFAPPPSTSSGVENWCAIRPRYPRWPTPSAMGGGGASDPGHRRGRGFHYDCRERQ